MNKNSLAISRVGMNLPNVKPSVDIRPDIEMPTKLCSKRLNEDDEFAH
jgi:hypothetical protein